MCTIDVRHAPYAVYIYSYKSHWCYTCILCSDGFVLEEGPDRLHILAVALSINAAREKKNTFKDNFLNVKKCIQFYLNAFRAV